jgi:hypothetical protein
MTDGRPLLLMSRDLSIIQPGCGQIDPAAFSGTRLLPQLTPHLPVLAARAQAVPLFSLAVFRLTLASTARHRPQRARRLRRQLNLLEYNPANLLWRER